MLSFFSSSKIQKEIALPFEVLLELKEDGYFQASAPALPGCTAQGRTKSEALRNISQAARHFMERAGQGQFEAVWEDAGHPCVHALASYSGQIVAASSRDGALFSRNGDLGSWDARPVSRAEGSSGNGHDPDRLPLEAGSADAELVDFTPQVYCLTTFGAGAGLRLYAGTSAKGGVYESPDGQHWELSFDTGEDRVHCLGLFKNRLYAGTSSRGRLFCFTGSQWSQVYRSSETALTAMAEFRGELYTGTYPSGAIYASQDGVHWHQAFNTGQTFVRALAVFKDQLYAATSKSTGGILFRTKDGSRWEKVFESRDPNFFCLCAFYHALWLGTGGGGRLYRSQDGENWTVAASLEEEGIRSLEAHEGRLYLGTETRGRIYRSTFSDSIPPQIEEIKVDDITSQSALIRWKTDRPADSLVRFGIAGQEGEYEGSVHSRTAETEHRVPLSYLKAQTRYRFKIYSRAFNGSEAAFSEEASFTTGGAELARIESPSHPEEGKWYKNPRAALSWSAPEGVVRFHYALDQLPNTEPAPGRAGSDTTNERNATFVDLKDGVWFFHLLTEDKAGNLGAQAAHFRLQVDTQALPPKLRSSTHPQEGAWSKEPEAQWQWEAPEDLSGIHGYYAVLDQAEATLPTAQTGQWLSEPRFSARLKRDGDWILHVVSVDLAGNVGKEAAHYRVRLDRRADPPIVNSSTHPDPLSWVNSSQVQLSWKEPQDASGVAGYYTLLDQDAETVPTAQNGAYTLSTQASFQVRSDGLWFFHIVTVDLAGNIGQEAFNYPIRVDTSAPRPDARSSTHPEGVWVASASVRFEILPPQGDLSGIAGYYWALDREKATLPTPAKASFTAEPRLEFEGLEDGEWHLHLVSKDKAGNVGLEAFHCPIRIDTKADPPVVVSSSHPNGKAFSRLRTVDLAWETPKDLSGIASYLYVLDQNPETLPSPAFAERTAETRLSLEVKKDGVWYFHIMSVDRAGNTGPLSSVYEFRVDTQALAPRIFSTTHPDPLAWYNHLKPYFEWEEPEDLSGVAGYYYILDRAAGTQVTPETGHFTTDRFVIFDRGVESDGAWYFHAITKDRAGNVSAETSHYLVQIDTTALPPTVSSPTHPDKNAWSSNNSPRFIFEPPQDASGTVGYYYILNHQAGTVPNEGNGTFTDETEAAFNDLQDGVWHLHVVSRDASGNVGDKAAHYTLRIDTEALPPAVTSPMHPPDTWVRHAAPTFTWIPPADASGIMGYYYILDQQPTTVPTRENGHFTTGNLANLPKQADGIWHFHIVSQDAAGNVGDKATHYTLQIDTSALPPKVNSSTHPPNRAWSRQASPQFSWQTPSDPSGIAGYFYLVDQSPATMPTLHSTWTTETHVTMPNFADGEWFFHIISRDGAGNLSTEAAHYVFRVDTQAPPPRLFCKSHPRPEEWGNNPRPTFAWDDGDDLSGIEGHYWIFDTQPATPLLPQTAAWTEAPMLTLPPQKDGQWHFHLCAKDKAGNLSEPVHLMVRIETQPPVCKIEPLPDTVNRPSFEVRWNGEDPISGVESFDVQSRQGRTGEWKEWISKTVLRSSVFNGADGGVYAFRVRARDRAGNLSAWPEKPIFPTVTVDLNPPTAVKNLSAKPGPKGAVVLKWDPSSDPVSGVAFYRIYRSEAPKMLGGQINPDRAITRTAFIDSGKELVDGQLYFYTVTAVDKAGNECREGNAQAAALCDRSAVPPAVTSTTHPVPYDWYREPRALLKWTAPPDTTGVAGYHYLVDQSPNSVPQEDQGTFTRDIQVDLGPLESGSWVFHIVTKDLAGNVSAEAAHYPLNIDLLAPPAPRPKCSSHPLPDQWYTDGDASFSWDTPADLSGIAGYYALIDPHPLTLPGPENGLWTTENRADFNQLEEGVWYLHVRAKDRAGNLGTEAGHCRIQVAKNPPPPAVISPSHPDEREAYLFRKAEFEWKPPAFSCAIVAYHFVLDQSPLTLPGPKDEKTSQTKASLEAPNEGQWYFHLVSVDEDGRLGRLATHFGFKVAGIGAIRGQVTLPNGVAGAEGVAVELRREQRPVAEAKTGSGGDFAFEGVAAGTYQLKLTAPSQPALLLPDVRLSSKECLLNISLEICPHPLPAYAGEPLTFYVMAKEEGQAQVKIYSEAGKVLGILEGRAIGNTYHPLAWSPAPAEGTYMFQASFKGVSGTTGRFPIRKITVSKKPS